jgi:hypothetical protein
MNAPEHHDDPAIDLAAVADAVDRSLHGSVPRERIDAVLHELLEQQLQDAKVINYLPIFLHRAACDSLRKGVPR